MSTAREYSSEITAEELEILAMAKVAGDAIDRGETFKDRWLPRGRGLVTARTAAQRLAHTQDPANKRYRNFMSEMMADYGLDRIPRADRDRLFRIMAREDEVVAWDVRFAANQRQKSTSPQTVWAHFERDHAPPKPPVEARPGFREQVAKLVAENDQLKRSGGSRFIWRATRRTTASPASWARSRTGRPRRASCGGSCPACSSGSTRSRPRARRAAPPAVEGRRR